MIAVVQVFETIPEDQRPEVRHPEAATDGRRVRARPGLAVAQTEDGRHGRLDVRKARVELVAVQKLAVRAQGFDEGAPFGPLGEQTVGDGAERAGVGRGRENLVADVG